MPRRVFLDVGGHLGETVFEVLKPRWRLDRIWTFEPAATCVDELRAICDARLEVVPAGWWTEDATMQLHDPGAIGASIVPEKALTGVVEECAFVDAARWVRTNVLPDDTVWLKLNCEGAECDIIDHLLDQDAMRAIDHLLVHFDVEKVPSIAHRAQPTRQRLAASSIAFVEAGDIMFGRSHGAKTANWLAWTEAPRFARIRYAHLNRVAFRLRQRVYPVKQRLLRRRPSARGAP